MRSWRQLPAVVASSRYTFTSHLVGFMCSRFTKCGNNLCTTHYVLWFNLGSITSQFAPSGNNGQATKTCKESGDRPPYSGWEVPYCGPRLKGGGLLAAACATGGSAACKPKGKQQPRHPEVRGTATAVVTPHLVPTILLQRSSCRPGL